MKMDREILFRGKVTKVPKYMQDKNRMAVGDWVYGSYVDYPVAQIFDLEDEYVVDPATVGQFTGLVDRTGKKIFEGDVVEAWSQGVKAQGVVQKRIDGLWIIYPAYQKNIIWGLCPEESGETNVTVIGNIHDNPELLKEEKQ